MQMREIFEQRTKEIDGIIAKYLPREEGHQRKVIEAMNYSVRAGGKRLRPMLMQETYRMFGGKSGVIEPFMAAIEMIHTYSLIHDDLPAMDNDEYRRGQKTTHAEFGEAIAILAGDGLLNYAYETALASLDIEPENTNIGKALRILMQKSGIYGMVGGQTVDVQTDQSRQVTKEQLDFIYRLKTGALLEASMVIGAVLAGATKGEQQIVEAAASEMGIAFQIQDDILDITGSREVLGKPIGSDSKNSKATYITYEGMEKAKADVVSYSNAAIHKINSLVVRNEYLTELIQALIHREK